MQVIISPDDVATLEACHSRGQAGSSTSLGM